jgi:hypothetical protein
MTARWQYLALVLVHPANHNLSAPQSQTDNYTIFRPDSDKRDGISGEIADWGDWLALLNDLGAEGWELTTGTIMETTLVAGLFGWSTVGTPVRQYYTFKRPTPER